MEAESTRLGSPVSSASGEGSREHSISVAGVVCEEGERQDRLGRWLGLLLYSAGTAWVPVQSRPPVAYHLH